MLLIKPVFLLVNVIGKMECLMGFDGIIRFLCVLNAYGFMHVFAGTHFTVMNFELLWVGNHMRVVFHNEG